MSAREHIKNAHEILVSLGLPRAQQNERSVLCLLSLLNLMPKKKWTEADNPLMGITPIMDWIRDHYKKTYAPNTRETVRRQTMHQFVAAGIVLYNPDKPDRPVNSPAAVYQIEPAALTLLRSFDTRAWHKNLTAYQVGTQSVLAILAATSDAGLAINDSQNGVVELDSNGNSSQVAGSLGGTAQYSWLGDWSVPGAQATSGVELPFSPDPGTVWASPKGNASQNGQGVALCPCFTQSTSSQGANNLRRRNQIDWWARYHGFSGFQLASFSPRQPLLAVHPNLSMRRFAMPMAQGGNLTYVLLTGDPGLNSADCPITNQGCHNVGQLFNLAASTEANVLTSAGGNTVIPDRVSSVEDFEAGLTQNGTITGGIYYFGHAAQADGFTVSLLAPGQGTGSDTNISVSNYQQLTNTNLAQNVTLTLNACNAGLQPLHGTGHSIAQLLANQLGRTVYAWKTGLFFSARPNVPAPAFNDPTKDPVYLQNGTIYMLPWNGVQACAFTPNQPEPKHCGGER